MAKNIPENKPADIVIAEDSPVQLETLKYVLEKNGHRVRSGTNGKQALDLIQSAPPDLVISDVIMPVMNGFELSREIRKNPAYDHIPVILLTSLTDTQDVALALESGADSFLTKPFNPDYLELRIRQILSPEHKMRARDTDKNSVAVSFEGTVYHIASDRGQMFEFLLTAYQVAIMKHREVVQAEEKLKKTNENISDLNTIISICNASLSAQEMFERLVKTIVEVLDFEFGAIYLFNDDRTSADLQYYYELIPAHDSFLDLPGRLDPNASRNARVLVNGKCGFYDLPRDQPYGEREKLIFEAMGAKAYVILPVKSAEQILGAIVLISTSEHSFATNEAEILESVGREVGSAVKRLLLQRRIETANEEIRLLNEDLEKRVVERTEALQNALTQIEKSLQEKEVMLREIHHRVKNNLQIIISLLNLQSRQFSDPQVGVAISESKNRIQAISMVHERLFISRDIENIDLGTYIRSIATNLFSFYMIPERQVQFQMTLENITITIDTAVPLGLVINELIANSLKHAFPGERAGQITIAGTDTCGMLEIRIIDNGIGMRPVADRKEAKTLGLKLVDILSQQLNGTVEFLSPPGTTVVLRIPKKEV